MTVYDVWGKLVFTLNADGKAAVQLDLTTIADGFYWLRIDTATSTKWKEIQVLKH